MTKKLEDLLNLPDSKEILEESKKEKQETAIVEQEETIRSIEELDKIQSALPAVKGLGELADKELNEVADKAMTAYEDLMDLGMNVESRYSGRVFEVAGGMLKTSLDAKVAKVDKKLKMIELQLKKAKLDQNSPEEEVISGTGSVVADRNELIKQILANSKDDK